MTTNVALPTGTFRNNDPRSSGRRLVNCMSEIAPQTSDLDLKSKIPPVYLRRMFGISQYASGTLPNPVLLLHMDTNFSDSSVNAFTMTPAGGAVISTAAPKFGAGDGSFPSATFTSVVTTPVAAGGPLDIFGPGSGGDFTIQGFFKAPAFGEPFVIVDYGDSAGNNGIVIEVHDANTIIVHPTIAGWTSFSNGGSAALPANVYHHIALVRKGSTATLYLNGFALPNNATNWTTSTVHPVQITIGASSTVSGASQPFFLDEFVVYNTALYSANFTPQIAPTPNPIPGPVSTVPSNPISFVMTAQFGNGGGAIGFDLFTAAGTFTPGTFTGADSVTYTVFNFTCATSGFDFQIQLNDASSQTGVFDAIQFVDANGVLHTFNSATADSFVGGGGSQATWTWHQPNGQMFTVPGTFPITMFLSSTTGPTALPRFTPVRGIWEMASVTYVVIGDSLFSMANDGTFTFPKPDAKLTLLATGIAGQGFVRMTDNTKCLFILVPNTNIGYTYTVANGFAQELDETFTFFGAKDVWFIDSFMVFLALNGLEFYNDDGQIVSGTGPITFTTGGVFPREFGTDPFVGMCVDHRTVHMFGTRTTEGYVDAGNATESPFAAAPDAFMQIGCHPNCGYTIALQDQAVFWVANDLTVRRLNGQTPVRVSNSGIENFLELHKQKLAGAYAICPTLNGHPLWVLTLPLAGKSIAYDCLTTEWIDLESLFNNLGFWRPLCFFNSQGLQLVGDSQSSIVGFLDATTFTEFGTPQAATFFTQSIYDNHNRIRHNRLELVMTAGGSTSIPNTARVTLLISNDSGAVFHAGQVKSLGKEGERRARAIWFSQGMSRDRAYGFQVSDPTPTFTVQVTADLAGGQW